jgi:hypothetical protein
MPVGETLPLDAGHQRVGLLLRFGRGTRTQTISDLWKRAREQHARGARA